MRDKRRRLRREREREVEREYREFGESQRSVPPCSYCGRRAGQGAIPDAARVIMHGPESGPDLEGTPVLHETGPHRGEPVIDRPRVGGWGCRHCIGGLPGEYGRLGEIHTIRYGQAPSREEVQRWRDEGRGRRSAPGYDPRPSWLIADEGYLEDAEGDPHG